MYWLNPTFAPIVVFALCMLLFGLLALSIANRKAARTASAKSSASARQTKARPAQNVLPTYGSQHTVLSSHSSGLTLSITANYAPREEAKVVAESVAQLMAPLNSAALRTRKESVQDSPVLPLADPVSAAPSENEAPATLKSEYEETTSSSPAIEESATVAEELPTQEITSGAVLDVADDLVLPLEPGAAEEQREAESAASPIALIDLPTPPAQHETPVDATLAPVPDLAPSSPSEDEAPHIPESKAEEATSPPSPAIEELPNGIEQLQAEQLASAAMTNATNEPASALQSAVKGELETDSAAIASAPAPAPVAVPKMQQPARNLLEFYGLRQQPFDVTPDPGYLYLSPSHREALASLSQGIEHLRGFMTFIAEPGMGKTTLMNKLMAELAHSARVVFLFQTQCSSSELLGFIMNELELDHAGIDVVSMHRALNQALLEQMLLGRRFVLIVDEAQNLQDSVLETIRLLSDFETTHSKLIQIILVGQPQLADTLMRPGLKQLRQRISVLTGLKALDDAETAEYVEHRVHAAGGNGKPLFTPEALTQIGESSKGVPRIINNLCFNAMLGAFADGKETIDVGIVKSAAEKLNLEALSSRNRNNSPNVRPKPKSGVTVCIGEDEEAASPAGKSVRIRIEQD